MLRDKYQLLDRPTRWLVITLVFPLICLNGWLALQILHYFESFVSLMILSVLLAFLLNPFVKGLERLGLGRGYAVGLVFAIVLSALGAIAVVIVPPLIEDFHEIIQAIPQWLESGNDQIQGLQTWLSRRFSSIDVTDAIAGLAREATAQIDNVADRILAITLVTFNRVVQAGLLLVFTFYLLLDGPRFAEKLVQKVPGGWGDRIRESLERNFQNYFISQLTVVAITSTLITLVLMLYHLDFALLFGISAGLMSFIPFGDLLVYASLGIVTALQNVWLGLEIILTVIGIDFLIDQILAPRLLGTLVGLRPFIVIASLIIGAKIAGVLGLIIAVPMASVIRDALDGFPNPSDQSPVSEPDATLMLPELEDVTS